jgi:hypothetical protein
MPGLYAMNTRCRGPGMRGLYAMNTRCRGRACPAPTTWVYAPTTWVYAGETTGPSSIGSRAFEPGRTATTTQRS